MAVGVATAAAEALKPDATVERTIATALSYLSMTPRKEVEQGLEWARNVSSWKELRPLYQEKYDGHPNSNAVEVLSGGSACFLVAEGDPKQAILYAVNFGRDTDCKAYICGGLAGALKGIEAIPEEWVKIVEEQVVDDPYTVSQRTTRESAEGLYEAAMNTMNAMKNVVGMVEELTRES